MSLAIFLVSLLPYFPPFLSLFLYNPTSPMNIIKSITFFGGAILEKNMPEYQEAYRAADACAREGLTVINGGGPGIMMAATTGAANAGGKTTAVYLEPDFATTFEGKEHAVKADTVFSEKNYIERTKKLMELGDSYVFFNGGTGTISEFAMCWVVARLYFGYHKPVLLYGSFWEKIIQSFTDHMHIRPDELRVLQIVESPAALIAALEKFEDLIEQDRRNYIETPGVEKCLMLGPK